MVFVHVEDYFDPTAGYQINELLIKGKELNKELNNEVFLITSKYAGKHRSIDVNEDKKFESITGVKIIRLDYLMTLSSRIIYKNSIFKEIEKLNPDIVFLHGIGDFKDLVLLGKKRKYFIVRDCHMSFVASKNRFKKLYYMIFRNIFAKVINNTSKYHKIYALGIEERQYLENLGIESEKIEYLYHGFNKDIMFYDFKGRIDVRNDIFVDKNDILIGYIGRFNYNKRPDIIFDIIDKLGYEYIIKNNIKFLFLGPKEEDYMNLFLEKMESVPKNIAVNILEGKDFTELRKYFSALDICVFPKECTLSSIHAQVCGCTVIMEDHISNRERVLNNKNLYTENDINEASNIIKRIIINKEYKDRNIIMNSEEILKREYKNQLNTLYSII